MLEVGLTLTQEVNEELVCFLWFNSEPPAVQAQEHVRRKERNPFVPVQKGMIDQQRLEQSRRHFS